MDNIPLPTEFDELPPLGDFSPDDLSRIVPDMDFVTSVLKDEKVRGFLSDPSIRRKGKQTALSQILEPNIHPILTHFIVSLVSLSGMRALGAEGKGFSPRHYATATLEMALMLGYLDKIMQDMVFADSVLALESVKTFMENPAVTEQGKAHTILELFTHKVHPLATLLLIFMYRMDQLRDFAATVKDALAQLGNTTGDFGGQLITAVPVSAEKLAEVEIAVSIYFKTPVRLNSRVDATMLGGALVVVGDMVLDATIEHRLELMRRQLLGETAGAGNS